MNGECFITVVKDVVVGLLVLGVVWILKRLWIRYLTRELKQTKKYLVHVTHMGNHPTDLFLHLFRFGVGIFLAFATALVLFAFRSGHKGDVDPIIGLLGLLIVELSGIAFWESLALSAKNIAATKDRIQKSIAAAEAKLGAS
jgi:hypothetical protein